MEVRKVKITQTRKENIRLGFVKELKDLTGYGLKEAKDLADKLNYGFDLTGNQFTIEIDLKNQSPISVIDVFAKSVNAKCTGEYIIIGGTQTEREIKLLSLGLGSEEEYVDFITEFIMTVPRSKIQKFISTQLSKMDKDELKETFNKLIE